jgi:hypothetical protein
MLAHVGDRLRNYTCADPTMVTTEKSIRDFEWEGRKVYCTFIHLNIYYDYNSVIAPMHVDSLQSVL